MTTTRNYLAYCRACGTPTRRGFELTGGGWWPLCADCKLLNALTRPPIWPPVAVRREATPSRPHAALEDHRDAQGPETGGGA